MGKYKELAEQIGNLVEEKNAAYGNSFEQAGEFLRLLYPNGIPPEAYGDMLCVVRIFDKLKRIATNKDAFGESPYGDIIGYGLLGLHKDKLAGRKTPELAAPPPSPAPAPPDVANEVKIENSIQKKIEHVGVKKEVTPAPPPPAPASARRSPSPGTSTNLPGQTGRAACAAPLRAPAWPRPSRRAPAPCAPARPPARPTRRAASGASSGR